MNHYKINIFKENSIKLIGLFVKRYDKVVSIIKRFNIFIVKIKKI